jgi:hypothetical protein
VGDLEARTPVCVESPFGYHPSNTRVLTTGRDPAVGQYQVGSLTGAVASERVTEAPKGSLRMVGNHSKECKCIRELDCERDISSRDESRD